MLSRTDSAGKAIVVGGSLGGLFVGTMLRNVGWDVQVYERSERDFDTSGGGIVLRPEVVELLRRAGVDVRSMALGVRSEHRVVFQPDGSIRSKTHAPQTQTAWALLYRAMRRAFGDLGLHKGCKVVMIRQDMAAKRVSAEFEDGSATSGDLLIGADGAGSTSRRVLWPEAQPSYAGYVAWRGLLREDVAPKLVREALFGDFGFANNRGSHMLGYLVPGAGGDVREGSRLYNWVWYRVVDEERLRDILTDRHGRRRSASVPEGLLAERWKAHLVDDAEALLPPAFAAVVKATAEPFVQAIQDLAVSNLVRGRVALIGDAPFIARPHTAAGTSKAAVNAMSLADALEGCGEHIDGALRRWEPEQVALGESLHSEGRRIGDALLFSRPSGMVG